MKREKNNALARLLCFLILTGLSFQVFSQAVQTKRSNVPINSNCNGFIEYLPSGYNTGEKYPLLIFFMGINSTGPGTDASLENMFGTGGGFIQDQVRNNEFPESFTVNGQTH